METFGSILVLSSLLLLFLAVIGIFSPRAVKRKGRFGVLFLYFVPAIVMLITGANLLPPIEEKENSVDASEALEKESGPTRASESIYNKDYSKAFTSEGMTNADIAWHALNTYGWDCNEVVSREEASLSGDYLVTCSNGKILRVIPRPNKHPKIRDKDGDIRRW